MQPQTAWGGCRTSTAVVLMEKVGQLSVRNATEIACLPLARVVGLDNPSQPPPGYFFMAYTFFLFQFHVIGVNPGVFCLQTDRMHVKKTLVFI